jgi:hypothetical protein
MFDQKMQHVAVSAEHLNQFELEGNTFLDIPVTKCGALLPAWNGIERDLH